MRAVRPVLTACLIAFFCLAGGPAALHSTTVERLTLEGLTKKARSIVLGRVLSSRTYWSSDNKLILTTHTIEVQEAIKGSAGRTIEVTTIGGEIGGTALHVAGMPVFTSGESAIVFVEQTGRYSTVVGLGQGKFTIRNGEVFNAVSDLSFPDGTRPRPTKMPLESFRKQIRSIVDR